jgi:putative transposase
MEAGTSREYAALAGDLDITLSVGRTGQCWHNALAESELLRLVEGRVPRATCLADARRCAAIVDYIGWINGTQLHSALGYATPNEFEAATGKEALAKVA